MEKNEIQKIALKYALYGAGLGLLADICSYILANPNSFAATMIKFVEIGAWIFFVYKGLNEVKSAQGHLTFGTGFKMSMIAVLLLAFQASIFMFIYISLIYPEYGDVVYQATIRVYENLGWEEKQIEQAEEILEIMLSPMGLSLSALFSAIFKGFFVSLILAAVVKVEKPYLED